MLTCEHIFLCFNLLLIVFIDHHSLLFQMLYNQVHAIVRVLHYHLELSLFLSTPYESNAIGVVQVALYLLKCSK